MNGQMMMWELPEVEDVRLTPTQTRGLTLPPEIVKQLKSSPGSGIDRVMQVNLSVRLKGMNYSDGTLTYSGATEDATFEIVGELRPIADATWG